ncbi:DUF2793 domain-containing protein [Chelativorans salis]|uniref:DUF2793 domain-containing protein n=1 Tax=Chelativorans salis TaxID=2978478 RepID=A0ABT2LJR4_9HYPH|nr:DUF2793 domain-containing protein [Chelativorans sp. EGI FJ00035]MCT7373653.1 DUF2793 domain-containing protein [Chelativorans sp. EGI FJ00035]
MIDPENTARLKLPYIMPSQAQKHVTHNEAIRLIDALVQPGILDRDLAAPPAGPAEGDQYIVGGDASGEWAGKEDHLAAFMDGAWFLLPPVTGMVAYVADEARLTVWDGNAWTEAVPQDFQNLALLGIGTTADAANPFAAKLENALWTAKTTGEGGSGDLRYKLNKEAAGNTVSLLFQTNWSGRAEFGLGGSDDFAIKVSADGAAWKEALKVDRASGTVSMPATPADGFSNWILNGDFSVNQRGGTRTPGIGVYGYDRWKGHANGLEQVVEGLPAGEYTLSWQGGGNGTFAGVTAPSPIKAFTSGGDASAVVPDDARRVCLLAGDKTGVSDPFVPRPAASELQLCQRYYEKSYDLGTTPGAATASGQMLHANAAQGTQICTLHYQRKRTAPTVTIHEPNTGTAGKVALSSGTLVNAAISGVGETACQVAFTTSGGAYGAFHLYTGGGVLGQ